MIQNARKIGRLIKAARTLARYDALWPTEVLGEKPKLADWVGRIARTRLPWEKKIAASDGTPIERLSRALQDLGPSYIKLGQLLATRPDIVGDEAAEDLRALQDRMPPFPVAEAKSAIQKDLGFDVDTLFEDFSDPIAAASIAQVHKATRRPLPKLNPPTPAGDTATVPPAHNDNNRGAVAVKVLRPGIERAFQRELDAFFFAARHVERWSVPARRLRPVAFVQTLADSTALEMDLRIEAAAASELAENTWDDPGFRVPKVDWERTSQRVLTIEWVDGIPINDIEALNKARLDLPDLANRVIQAFLRQALRDGFFHADMHQGNLLVEEDGTLVAIDFGIMGRLDHASRKFMAETLFGFLMRDYKRVADVHFDAGFVPRSHARDAFAQALRAIGEPIFDRGAEEISMAKLLTQLFQTTDTFDMRMQPQLVLLQKTMVVVEGVARNLDPRHNIWEAARPVLEEWMTQQLGPEARISAAAEDAVALGRVLRSLPGFLTKAENAAATLTDEGIRLDPETARIIGESEARANRGGRIALWIIAASLAAIAISLI